MYENIVELVGEKTGSTSIIIGGVHGNEKCGVEALNKILPTLQIESGRVIFAYGNPKAIRENVRFTEVNLNRIFRPDYELSDKEKQSYEYTRAKILKEYLDQADALLDIHASSIPDSDKFIICEKSANEVAQYLPIDTVVHGFDDFEFGSTDYYMNLNGKIGICLECGYLGDDEAVLVAIDSIFAFLNARNHISTNDQRARVQNKIQIFKKYFTKTNRFTLAKEFSNFEILEKDQLIGVDGEEEIRSEKKCVILFAHNGKNINDEVFLLGGI